VYPIPEQMTHLSRFF